MLVRQVLGAIAQFEKTSLVAKLKAARDRKKAARGPRFPQTYAVWERGISDSERARVLLLARSRIRWTVSVSEAAHGPVEARRHDS